MGQRQGPMAAKTVLVTGGSGGIGRATALGLADQSPHAARPFSACRGSMCSSTTSAATGTPATSPGWAGAHLRPQPSGAVPAHQPAGGPAHPERPGAGGHGLLQRPCPGADRQPPRPRDRRSRQRATRGSTLEPPRLRQQRHRGFLRRRALTPATIITRCGGGLPLVGGSACRQVRSWLRRDRRAARWLSVVGWAKAPP
jgi:hypothetical protein